MAQRSEDIKQGPLAGSPKEGDGHPNLQPRVATSVPDTKPAIPTTLPLVDYRLISVPAEAERRAHLLSRVTVDANGVAHCLDDRSVTETLLAAVRVDDNKDASLVPFVTDQDQLRLILPSDRLSRIGFFVGYASSQEISAVLRMGLYPGIPLTTQAVTDAKTAEVMYGLGAIKAAETDELKWAEQVGLYLTLGFDPTHARGIFNKNHRPNPATDSWQESPLIILPDDLLNMFNHYNPEDVKKDNFQIQFYGVRPVPTLPIDLFDTRGVGETLSFGGGMKGFGEPTRGLGIGFGKAVSRIAQTRATNIDSLRGAFQIIVTPQQ